MSREKGFTLIELLIAMTIFATVAILFLQTFLLYMRYNVEIKSKEIAQSILTERMNRLISIDYNSLVNGTSRSVLKKNGITFFITETISSGPKYKDIEVTVAWSILGKNFSRTVSSRRSLP